MAVDWSVADRRAIAKLHTELRPMHYRELARVALRGMQLEDYSEKTDPEEKFRQHVDEGDHPILLHIPGGNIGLWAWFPLWHQPRLLPPEPFCIEGRCLISYKAGYEHAKRGPFLFDHYHDGNTEKRFDRRMAAFQFEHHVRNYYLNNWPRFCQLPSNHGVYDKPAVDDFRLVLPGSRYRVDAKSASFNEDGFSWYKARRIHADVIYIAGRWEAETEMAIVDGIVPGKWLLTVGRYTDGDMFCDGDLMSFEVLSVMLTMADCGMNWAESWSRIRQDRQQQKRRIQEERGLYVA